jgi:hypothetical protein
VLRIFALSLVLIGSAGAGAARDWPSTPFRGAGPAPPPCTCRGPGAEAAVGDEVCLATPAGGRRARCVMALNNTSWDITTETCGTTASLTH